MKPRKFKVEREGANGWTRWLQPVPRGYLLACCDCGLVHRMEFRIAGGSVQFRAQRAPRITARLRRSRGK